ncbi:hypothetical protein [Streptomyces sp. NPDC058741]|uniref:hypothetical protein n=1 Tax=unclassified Streptomyces TaxID=2593676 RepID=UPI0036C8B50C
MASYFERLDREESAVRDQLSGLHEDREQIHKQIGEAEDRLRRLAITRETLNSLPPDTDPPGGTGAPEGESAAPSAPMPEEVHVPPASEAAPGSAGPLEWEEGRQRMLSLLATAGQAMKAREIAMAIGEDVSTPARVETTRGRLKRLAEEGHVVEDPVGWFAIAAGSGEGTAEEG